MWRSLWGRYVLLVVSVWIKVTWCQIQNADYTGKVNVRVNQVLSNRPDLENKGTWPLMNSQEFSKVNVNIFGRNIYSHFGPKESQRNPRKLRRILGSFFEKEFMSIDKPKSTTDPKNLPPQKPDPDLIKMVENFKFNFTDQAGASLRVDKQHEFMFRKWLVEQATCPIDFFWEDIGPLFWPRHVRRGRCLPSHHCSWPRGMKCQASHSRTLKLLQWTCSREPPNRKNKRNSRPQNDGPSRNRGRSRSRKRKHRRGKRRGKHRRFWEPRDDRRKYQRIRRRLIRKMSSTRNGYHCQWRLQAYVVHDRCSCSCHK